MSTAGVFEGVFTKRGETEVAESPQSGAFEEVFVRRGRWRKSATIEESPSISSVVRLAETLAADDLECLAPSFADAIDGKCSQLDEEADSKLVKVNPTHFIVKNTFIDAPVVNFSSLKGVLTERKVQSCPLSRINIDDIMGMENVGIDVESVSKDWIFNTASTFGDINEPLTIAEHPEMQKSSGDDANIVQSGSTSDDDSDPSSNDLVYNTGSTMGYAEFEGMHQRMTEVDCKPVQVHACLSIALSTELAGSGAFGSLQQPQHPFFALPHNATMQGVMPVPPPPLEMAPPPVLRLAEALPPPELTAPAGLPSIGSEMHYLRVCKPCTFYHTRGCENGAACNFCHLCTPGEKKRRLRAQRLAVRCAASARLLSAPNDDIDEDDMIVE